MSKVEPESWYWCLRHDQVEDAIGCRADDRLGPYESPEAAAHWRDRVDARNQQADDDDREWSGEEDE